MTLLTRPLRRETAVLSRSRPIIIECRPHHITLREKGRRLSLTVHYRAILDLAYKQLAREQAAERKLKAQLRRSR